MHGFGFAGALAQVGLVERVAAFCTHRRSWRHQL